MPSEDPDPDLNPRSALGVACDDRRDLLYVSFCQQGCANLLKGLVVVVDPATAAVTGELFRTNGFPDRRPRLPEGSSVPVRGV